MFKIVHFLIEQDQSQVIEKPKQHLKHEFKQETHMWIMSKLNNAFKFK